MQLRRHVRAMARCPSAGRYSMNLLAVLAGHGPSSVCPARGLAYAPLDCCCCRWDGGRRESVTGAHGGVTEAAEAAAESRDQDTTF